MTFSNRWRRAALIVPALALALGTAVACGGDDDDAGNGATGPTATRPADSDAGVPEGAAVVDQKSLKFLPTKVTVKAGETVYFTNSETAVHNVAVDGEDVTGLMRKGAVASYVFEMPGEYRITCDFHPQMKATVVVES